MNRFIILMLLVIFAFFIRIWYQLSIPGDGNIEEWCDDCLTYGVPLP